MHNLKDVRSNFKIFGNKIRQRNSDINIEELKNLDTQNRNLIQKNSRMSSKRLPFGRHFELKSPKRAFLGWSRKQTIF